MNLGSALRKRRKEQRLTLKAVAEKAGISEGFLSQVENDVNSPSVETLVNICNAIGIEAGDVIRQAQNQEMLVIIRKSDWEDVELPSSGFVTRRFFSPENRRVIDSSVLAIEPGKSIPARKNIKNSQEVLCVLKGSVELVHGGKTLKLSKGDSVHYWSIQQREIIINKGRGLAVVLWVGTL
ncbi:MAG: helix-turn-helix domain-containing protein [Deltaproteobacteria bacterium]|nr:helix-turn-helix domain-containing protein [Deltaproteobacteria bacterium]